MKTKPEHHQLAEQLQRAALGQRLKKLWLVELQVLTPIWLLGYYENEVWCGEGGYRGKLIESALLKSRALEYQRLQLVLSNLFRSSLCVSIYPPNFRVKRLLGLWFGVENGSSGWVQLKLDSDGKLTRLSDAPIGVHRKAEFPSRTHSHLKAAVRDYNRIQPHMD